MSIRLQVMQALRSLIEGAVSPMKVLREGDPPEEIGADGVALIADDDIDTVEESGDVWQIEHNVRVTLVRQDYDDAACEAALDAKMDALWDAIMADRSLGGLVGSIWASPAVYERVRDDGVVPIGTLRTTLTLSYETNRATG